MLNRFHFLLKNNGERSIREALCMMGPNKALFLYAFGFAQLINQQFRHVFISLRVQNAVVFEDMLNQTVPVEQIGGVLNSFIKLLRCARNTVNSPTHLYRLRHMLAVRACLKTSSGCAISTKGG